MAPRTHCKRGHRFTKETTYQQHGGRGCKTCKNERQRKKRALDPERFRAYYRKHWRKHALKHLYGLSWEEFEALLEKQKGVCAICGTTREGTLGVDHDHKTGKVRGLLCKLCNRGIGIFEKDPGTLQRAIDYLKAHGV